MKKNISLLLLFTILSTFPVIATAAEQSPQALTITVSGQAPNESQIPRSPYFQGKTVMVPLRSVAEALGYTVSWDEKTQTVSVEMDIQTATLSENSAEAVIHGKLKIIDLSRTETLPATTVIHDGRTYVPLEFFEFFFNDVSVDQENGIVSISPSMCEIQ